MLAGLPMLMEYTQTLKNIEHVIAEDLTIMGNSFDSGSSTDEDNLWISGMGPNAWHCIGETIKSVPPC